MLKCSSDHAKAKRQIYIFFFVKVKYTHLTMSNRRVCPINNLFDL